MRHYRHIQRYDSSINGVVGNWNGQIHWAARSETIGKIFKKSMFGLGKVLSRRKILKNDFWY